LIAKDTNTVGLHLICATYLFNSDVSYPGKTASLGISVGQNEPTSCHCYIVAGPLRAHRPNVE